MTGKAGTPRLREGESTREALTRILAIESRNALARVELAASELSRFESTPAAVDRISTIHHAVDQIDGLLEKIDLLASPPIETRWLAIEVESVWQSIRERLAPTLAARGIRFRQDREDGARTMDVRIEIPEPVLESILCALLRVVLAAVERDQELRFELEHVPNGICAALAVLPSADGRLRLEIDREDWFELEVQLAEWGGTLAIDTEASPDRLQIFLPVGSLDA